MFLVIKQGGDFMGTLKKRNWGFCVYPDSALDDWRERLEAYGVPCAVSPLHDSDKNKDGSLKKPHYHVILCYKHPTTMNNVLSFVEFLTTTKHVEPLNDLLGAYEYLWHKNHPDKAQYKQEDVVTYCGFKIPREKLDQEEAVVGLFAFIRDNQITDYAFLIDVLSQSNELDLLSCAVRHAYAVISYLRSACQQ